MQTLPHVKPSPGLVVPSDKKPLQVLDAVLGAELQPLDGEGVLAFGLQQPDDVVKAAGEDCLRARESNKGR